MRIMMFAKVNRTINKSVFHESENQCEIWDLRLDKIVYYFVECVCFARKSINMVVIIEVKMERERR